MRFAYFVIKEEGLLPQKKKYNVGSGVFMMKHMETAVNGRAHPNSMRFAMILIHIFCVIYFLIQVFVRARVDSYARRY